MPAHDARSIWQSEVVGSSDRIITCQQVNVANFKQRVRWDPEHAVAWSQVLGPTSHSVYIEKLYGGVSGHIFF